MGTKLGGNRTALSLVAGVATVAVLAGCGGSEPARDAAVTDQETAPEANPAEVEAAVAEFCEKLPTIDGADELKAAAREGAQAAQRAGSTGQRFRRAAEEACGDEQAAALDAAAGTLAESLCDAYLDGTTSKVDAAEERLASIASSAELHRSVVSAVDEACGDERAAVLKVKERREKSAELRAERDADRDAEAARDSARGYRLHDTHSCTRQGSGYFTYEGRITNTGYSTNSYVVNVELVGDDGVRYGDGMAVVRNLRAGDVATWEATGSHNAGSSEKLTCKVASVDVR